MKNKYVIGGIIAVAVIVVLVIVGMSATAPGTYTKKNAPRPFLGKADSAIVVQEFSDFQCPFCKNAAPVVKDLAAKYGDGVKFEYHYFPLTRLHANAMNAALAAECANDQSKFWEMHDKIFENQDRLTKSNLKSFAKELGLKESDFNACLDTRAYVDVVNADLEAGKGKGVQGTPTFFVNGEETRLELLEAKILELKK